MKHLKSLLLGSTAVILTLGIPAASAQDKGAGASGGAQVQGGAQTGQGGANVQGGADTQGGVTTGRGGANVQGGADARGGAQMKQDKSGAQAQGEGKSRGSVQSERGSADAKTEGKARSSAETRQGDDSGNRTESRADRQREGGDNKDRAARGERDSRDSAQKRSGESGQVKFTSKQQTQVRTYFQKNKVSVEPVKEVNVSISVGRTVPSHIHFHPLPATIFVDAPADREYVYFVYRNDIIVVDADTLVIVYVVSNVA